MNKSVLPALSVALGLPLCHHNVHKKNEPSRLTALSSSSSTSSSSVAATKSSSSAVDNETTSSTCDVETAHAQRVRNNVARIYARRMMDRCQLERQHPYYSSPDENCSNTLTTGYEEKNVGISDSNVKPSQNNNNIEEALRSKLLSETLLSLIEMKEKLSFLSKDRFGLIIFLRKPRTGSCYCRPLDGRRTWRHKSSMTSCFVIGQ